MPRTRLPPGALPTAVRRETPRTRLPPGALPTVEETTDIDPLRLRGGPRVPAGLAALVRRPRPLITRRTSPPVTRPPTPPTARISTPRRTSSTRIPPPRRTSGTPLASSTDDIDIEDLDEGIDIDLGIGRGIREIPGALWEAIRTAASTAAGVSVPLILDLGRALGVGATEVFYGALATGEKLYKTIYPPPPPGTVRIDLNNHMFFNFNNSFDEIVRIFNNMDLRNLEGNIKRIGEDSANAYNNLISWNTLIPASETRPENEEFVISAVLKNANNPFVDNNYYEFLVGLCVNELKRLVPNFIFTYNYYLFHTPILAELKKISSRSDFLKQRPRDVYIIKSSYNELPDDRENKRNFEWSCERNGSTCIEAITDNVSLEKWLKSREYGYHELINILFQVYYTLDRFKNIFTHYDLHYNNVLIKKVPDNKFISIKYHGLFTIHTKYIPVIIDYGRCYIDCSRVAGKSFITSKKMADTMCSLRECLVKNRLNQLVGKNDETTDLSCSTKNNLLITRKRDRTPKLYDYSFARTNDGFGYINPEVNNVSQDNRLIALVMSLLRSQNIDTTFANEYRGFNRFDVSRMGLPSNSTRGYPASGTINNVTDSFNFIMDMYEKYNSANPRRPEFKPVGTKYGEIEIYNDKPWKFTKSP